MAILESCKFGMIMIRQDETCGEITIEAKPLDFDERDADEVDRAYDEIVEHGLEDADDFSVLTDEARERLEEEEQEEEAEKKDEFIGDEENLLDEEDD